jgi:hypothetical protein
MTTAIIWTRNRKTMPARAKDNKADKIDLDLAVSDLKK